MFNRNEPHSVVRIKAGYVIHASKYVVPLVDVVVASCLDYEAALAAVRLLRV